MVRDIKANTSKWVHNLDADKNRNETFEWQIGYGAFTVSYSHVDQVSKYIQNLREHHRQKSFREEYVEILKKHDIPFESRYLFEGEFHG